MGKEWLAIIETRGLRHVIPLNDLGDHDTHAYYGRDGLPLCDCHCTPRKEWMSDSDAWVFVHSSFDGREGCEWANEILNKTVL